MPPRAPFAFAPYRRRWRCATSTPGPVPGAPSAPNTPTPSTGGTKYYAALRWLAAGATKFDVYLDTNPVPTTLVSVHGVDLFVSPTVLPNTTYYWQVVAFNDGGQTAGPIWSFTTPAATSVIVSINGAIVTSHLRSETLTVHDPLGATAKTATARFDTTAPSDGQIIKIGLGSLDPSALIFGGEVQQVTQVYEELLTNLAWDLDLIDYTVQLNKRRPYGSWTNVSATTIVQYCVAVFAPGFTTAHVQQNLPAISITFDGQKDFSACMTAIATAIAGHYAGPDFDHDIHLFLEERTDAPDPIDNAHPPLDEPTRLAFTTDTKQIRTRVLVTGGGTTVPCAVPAGCVTVPVAAAMFSATGGTAILNGWQVITYASMTAGGGVGSVTGATQSPAAMTATTSSTVTDGKVIGTVGYRVAFSGPLGESDWSAAVTATPNKVSNATWGGGGGFTTTVGGAGNVDVGSHQWFIAPFTAQGETDLLISGGALQSPGAPSQVTLNSIVVSSDVRITGLNIYRTKAGASATVANCYLVGTIQNGTTTFVDNVSDANLGKVASSVYLAGGGQVTLTNIPLGPAGTTGRHLYRTVSGGSAYLSLYTVPDNVTTSYVDKADDSALGASPPNAGASTVGAAAGSTTLAVPDLSQFSVTGGWASAGSMVIRYDTVSALTGSGTLTGIPASGSGAITATLSVGTVVTALPSLNGVNAYNGLSTALAAGAAVALYVVRDDLAAQTALGLLERDDNGNPTDGIHEFPVNDATLTTVALCTARGDAELALFSRPIVTAVYCTNDPKTKSGKTVSIDLTTGIYDPAVYDPSVYDTVQAWGIAADFVIQDVTITEVDVSPNCYPLYTVSASSVRFSVEDLVRRWQLAA